MRIVSWNLGHKTKPRLVPLLGRVVAALRPDLLFLNEYAHDDEMAAPMLDELRELDFALASLELVGWQIPRPPWGQWSYKKGNTKTRIDQVLAWQVLPSPSAEYVTDVNGIALAGRSGAVSDHAGLVVDVPMLMPADR